MYLNPTIEKFPVLNRDRERDLADDINGKSKTKAKKAVDTLVQSNLRLAIKIANEVPGVAHHDREDLISEAILGLYSAAERYKNETGAKFSTYARWYILQRIQQYIQHSRLVRLPQGMGTACTRVKRIAENLTEELGYKPSNEEISELTGVSVNRLESLQGYSNYSYISLNTPINKDNGEGAMTVAEIIEDEITPTPDQVAERLIDLKEQSTVLQKAMDGLTEREKKIVEMRFGMDGKDPKTLEEVGSVFKITRERTRQIQELAMVKIKRNYNKVLVSSN